MKGFEENEDSNGVYKNNIGIMHDVSYDSVKMNVKSARGEIEEFYGKSWYSPGVDIESVIIFVGYK